MKITITARNYELTEALKDYAEGKILNLERYFGQIVNVHITFSLEKYRHTVEMTVHINGKDLNSKVVSDDMYASIDRAVEKLERQILKHKGKRMKRKTQAKRPDIEIALSSDQSVAIGDKPKKEIDLVHANLAEFPLLTAEEAAREMSGDGADFKIFSNAETNRLSIVYKRDDGKIGFIEA